MSLPLSIRCSSKSASEVAAKELGGGTNGLVRSSGAASLEGSCHCSVAICAEVLAAAVAPTPGAEVLTLRIQPVGSTIE